MSIATQNQLNRRTIHKFSGMMLNQKRFDYYNGNIITQTSSYNKLF